MLVRIVVGCVAVVVSLVAYPNAARSYVSPQIAIPIGAGTRPAGVAAARQQPGAGAADGSGLVQMALDRYCLTCHNSTRKTAGLALDALNLTAIGSDAETWEKVVRKLRTRAMPPAGARRPAAADYDRVAAYLEGSLDRAAAAAPNPGRLSAHRLNRAEYNNAIRDLLAVEVDSSWIPGDDSGYGFDNIADVLSLSPALLERYLSTAQKISRLAIGAVPMRPVVETYAIHNDFRQDARMGEDFPFGTRGGMAVRHYFPADGEYVLKIRLQREAGKEIGLIRGIAERQYIEARLDGERIAHFTVGGTDSDMKAADAKTADEVLEVRFAAKTGTRRIAVAFEAAGLIPENLTPRLPVRNYAYTYSSSTEMGVDRLLIEGPYDVTGRGETPSRQRILVCHPATDDDGTACAATILSGLARRAYRRPVTPEDLEPLLAFYRAGSRQHEFEDGIELALTRILISPHFLFRVEGGGVSPPEGAAFPVSDLELASRLSFFLWSSLPDDELIDVAAQGGLRAPGVLDAQVRRMLADSRSEALIDNFVGQWLYLRNIPLLVPDAKRFPDFDQNLREAFVRETELFVGSQLREDRGVMELLTAPYSFLNERLARHYGIPGIYGSHFRRVTYEGDSPRVGVLGHGSLLTATSYADRTSPVLRGKWVLENILGAPPPAPPPDVPALGEDGPSVTPRTMRERMEQHRTNPVCASCHTQMDPIGFALENFDAVGRWRTAEGGTPIDASGVLADGRRFDGPVELRRFLVDQETQFVTTVIEKLLTYALGRGIEYYDAPAVRAVAREAAVHEYRWSSIISGIVQSVPFQMRRSQ